MRAGHRAAYNPGTVLSFHVSPGPMGKGQGRAPRSGCSELLRPISALRALTQVHSGDFFNHLHLYGHLCGLGERVEISETLE